MPLNGLLPYPNQTPAAPASPNRVPTSPTAPRTYGPSSGIYNPENAGYRGPITGTAAGQAGLAARSQASPFVTNPPQQGGLMGRLPQMPQMPLNQGTPNPAPMGGIPIQRLQFGQLDPQTLIAQLRALFPQFGQMNGGFLDRMNPTGQSAPWLTNRPNNPFGF